MERTAVRVGIVEDQCLTRELLSRLLEESEGFRVSGAFGCMEEALDRIGGDRPDVLLVDIGLPGMSGIEGIRLLRTRFPGVQPLVLSIYEDDERIFDAICSGACGYVLKRTLRDGLLANIQQVVDGGAPMSPLVARKVIQAFRGLRAPRPAGSELTPYQLRLLKLLVAGHTYKSAAAELGISTHTVSFHLRRVYEKLHVHSKCEAVGKAMRDGIVD